MSRQYVEAKFRLNDKRAYTYHNDGDPLAVGDKVEVDSPRDEGKMTIHVVGISSRPPKFPTKPILRKVLEEPKADGLFPEPKRDVDI